jgi:hypothetical protein
MIDRGGELAEALEAAHGGAGAHLTPYGEVRIRSAVVVGNVAEVHLEDGTEGGDPHFRIVNPPLLVEDANGDVRNAAGTFRRDPVAALAYVIGSLGGAVKRKGRRG